MSKLVVSVYNLAFVFVKLIVPLFVKVLPAAIVASPARFIVPLALTKKFCVASNEEVSSMFMMPIAS